MKTVFILVSLGYSAANRIRDADDAASPPEGGKPFSRKKPAATSLL
jgi:hypothetical protein